MRRTEFVRVQNDGRKSRSEHFLVIVHPRHDAPDAPSRLGVVASRRVGNAVVRNRGKRRVREWFRRREPLPPGLDVVVILRAGAPLLSFDQVAGELDEALRRATNPRPPRRRGRS